ncbi:MFS transporter [Aspergillus homomorphus CBS 101889]|uniref:Aminotriazole resistance protein n=1 Tax=Aspergillus homomorphus (strain CBS 101889) TaxID=1450537 RepID=A0A395HQC1_ASPHC|nr:aminotriazole resistance protein [Aspergillus homomorphus CBS 101889]RAL09633.1 aminotriazole resistance protein [Aspergillus homomorphus CBS 101889]
MGGMNRAASLATLAIVCLVFFVDIANLGMANIALPTIQKDLGYNDGTRQWVLTAYQLTFGGFLMAGGRLGDIFGHKYVLLAGMTLFNAATLVCALVNDQIGLIIGRAFQGIAAALTIPSAQSLVALSFSDPKARVKAFSAWGACGSTGFVFGPIFGGLFTSLVTWQWIFWLSLIVEGALEIAALALLFTKNLPDESAVRDNDSSKWSNLHIRIDILGTSISVAALILLVYGLTTANIHGWDQVDVITTLVIAVVLFFVFVLVELKVSSHPILPDYLWGDRIKVLGCVVAALTYAVWQGSNYLLTLQLQNFGFSALSTALRFLPLGITACVVNFVIPMLLAPVGARKLLIASWLLALAGLILLTRMGAGEDYWRLCLPGMILYIAGIGTVYFVGNVSVVATANKEHQGTVSGVYNMFLNVGGATLGVAVLTVISDSVATKYGGKNDTQALLEGYRAGYYGAIAMIAIGFVVSFFFAAPAEKNEDEGGNNATPTEMNNKAGEGNKTNDGKDDKQSSPISDPSADGEEDGKAEKTVSPGVMEGTSKVSEPTN